jgi:hypothetical protein
MILLKFHSISEAKNAEVKPGGPRNLKLSADVQNFYRFVYENNLRREGRLMLEAVVERVKAVTKKAKGKRARKAKKAQ